MIWGISYSMLDVWWIFKKWHIYSIEITKMTWSCDQPKPTVYFAKMGRFAATGGTRFTLALWRSEFCYLWRGFRSRFQDGSCSWWHVPWTKNNHAVLKNWRNMGTNLKRGSNTCCFGFLCKNWFINICMYVYVCAQYRCTAKWSFGRVHSCWKSSQQLQIVIVWTIPWCSVWRKLILHPSECIPHQMIFYSNWQHPHSGHYILNLLGTKGLSLISGSTS